MAMHPRNKKMIPRRHLFIKEWMEALQISDKALGERMGVSDVTVYRWYKEPRRLDPDKLAAIADGLGLESPALLWRRPGPSSPERPSIDVILRGATDQQIQATADFVEKYILPRE